MSVTTEDELSRIIAKHRQDVAAAKLAAEQLARTDEHSRHDCEAPIRNIALPLLRDWSARLAVEGYPTSIEDRLTCRPPALVFRFTPRGNPESTLTLACEAGPAVGFKMAVEGRVASGDMHTPLADLEAGVVRERLAQSVTAALEASIRRRSDCGPPAVRT